jgi:hypothetical protein
MREAGVPVKRIAKHLGRQNSSLRKLGLAALIYELFVQSRSRAM